MDFNTLKNIYYNMPETWEDASKENNKLCDIIRHDIMINAMIKGGLFKDTEDFSKQCEERYTNVRNNVIKQLEEMMEGQQDE